MLQKLQLEWPVFCNLQPTLSTSEKPRECNIHAEGFSRVLESSHEGAYMCMPLPAAHVAGYHNVIICSSDTDVVVSACFLSFNILAHHYLLISVRISRYSRV